MITSLARWCFRNPWLVIAGWVVALFAVFGAVAFVGAAYDAAFEIPDSESRRGFDALDEHFGGFGSGQSGSIVFRSDDGIDDPAIREAMEAMFATVAGFEGVTLSSPYEGVGAATQVSADRTIAYAALSLSVDLDFTETGELGLEMVSLTPDIEALQVEIGGAALAEFEPPATEFIGLAFAVFVLIIAFGSVLAMGLPIGVALAGVGTGIGLITLISNLTTVPDFATTIGAMIGLGVGIDYALFIVSRYREGLHAGQAPEDATVAALDTAGRAVIFAGLAVVISLLGMLLMGLAFISGLGLGAATTVAVTMIASITLLPALLAFAGDRIEVTRWRELAAGASLAIAFLGVGLGLQPLLIGFPLAIILFLPPRFARGLGAALVIGSIGTAVPEIPLRFASRLADAPPEVAFGLAGAGVIALLISLARPLARLVPSRPPKPVDQTLSYRWSRVIQSHPWMALVAGSALLLVLAAPLLSLRLGFSDEGNYPESTTTRQAYDLLADGFGPGFNGPLLITAEVGDPTDQAVLPSLIGALEAAPGVASVGPPFPSDVADPQASAAYLIQVFPDTSPQDEETDALVETLRDDVIPAALDGSTLAVNVTGTVAANIDFSSYLAGRIIIFFAAVLMLSFLLLMAVFRSLLVPLKAVVMNMLSIAAAYGIIIAIFQWGWLGSLFRIDGAPIEPFIPMMMFAIVFGLSMDYEVFLLSRVKEQFDRTGDPVGSVADGLASTAQVITAAAAIMVVVFGSFVFEDDRIIKLFGVGLATAVFLDASVVRMLLVPATMELLGRGNWWLPGRLDRILPVIHVEGGAAQTESEAAGGGD